MPQMIQLELKEDLTQINLESLPGLVERLKQLSVKAELDHELSDQVAEWNINGWLFILNHSDELDEHPVDSTINNSLIGLATAWARLTRDLAGSFKQFQVALRPTIKHIVQILWLTSAVLRLDQIEFQPFNKFSIQALSNLITLNPSSILHIWTLLIDCKEKESILLRLLYTQNHALLSSISVLILNAVRGNSATIDSLITSPVGKQAMTMLLEKLDGLLNDETEVVFEVIVSIVRVIINEAPISQIPKLYYSQATPSQVLSPAQLSILKILETSSISSRSSPFLLEQFTKLSNSLEQSWQGLVLVAEMLCKSMENNGPISSDEIRGANISDDEACKVVEISIYLLRELEKEKNQINESDSRMVDKMRSMNQILIGLIKLLTCLLELRKPNTCLQDSIRSLDGIPTILNFTKFDVNFPYLSERSVLLLKYLLKDNVENQAVVKSYKPVS